MTGFATLSGSHAGWAWAWDLRAVNARGLDLRLRLPDWIEGLEAAVRATLGPAAARGNLTLGLRIQKNTSDGAGQLDPEALATILAQIRQIEDIAAAQGVTLAPSSAVDLLAQRRLSAEAPDADTQPLRAALLAELPDLIAAFDAMRRSEGAALAAVIAGQLDRIAALTAEAADLAEARKDAMAETLRQNLARVMETAETADPDRVAQELALIAVKTDVTEELDRLVAHVAAARTLLAEDGPVGRKLDFLTQEFNREANTLCSKAQSAELTRAGLDLKATIDQMREQVQNVE